MKYSYTDVKSLNGLECLTLTHNIAARVYVDDENVTIHYKSGNSLEIPRSMIEEALHILNTKGNLTLDDVHEGITGQHGPITDRLLAVMRKLPGTTHTSSPRAIFVKND